jgi:repressor of nif and glnA expression
MLLFWNHLDSWNQTAQEWSLEGPLQISVFETKNLEIVEDRPMNITVQFGFNHICSFWEEGIWTSWIVLYKVTVFRSSQIFNMAATANNMLWLAEISKIFFSETNELTVP